MSTGPEWTRQAELAGNPHDIDYENGVIYFKNAFTI